jgi:hypothetical protein
MITAGAVVERHPGTMHMMTFGGVDPKTMADAVRVIVGGGLADHIDPDFGCRCQHSDNFTPSRNLSSPGLTVASTPH